uniref:MFS domain-containing protein n=1 Tax=Macrostomum lignano TaxID=282301 RepID=A0A1I8FQY5_9PLAT
EMVFEMVGTLFGVMTFTFITQVGPDRCTLASASGNSHSNGSLLSSNQSAPATAHRRRPATALARPSSAPWCCCGGGIGFFGTKEIAAEGQAGPNQRWATPSRDSNSDSMLATFRSCLGHRPYRLLMLSFMLSSLAIQTVQNSLALYTIYSLKMKPHLKFAIAVVMVTAILVTPLVFYLIRRLGKKRVFIIGLALILPVCLSATFCPARVQFVPQYYATMVVAGCYVSINMLLPWIMLPRRQSMTTRSAPVGGTRPPSTACTCSSTSSLWASAPPACSWDFTSPATSCRLPAISLRDVGYALRVMMGPLPMLLVVAAFIVLRLYPITPEYRRNLDKRMLKAAQLDGLPMNLKQPGLSGLICGPAGSLGQRRIAALPRPLTATVNGGGGPSGSGIVGCCLHPGGGDSGCGGSDSASPPIPTGVCRKKRLSSSSSSSHSLAGLPAMLGHQPPRISSSSFAVKATQ